jgi:hypothetical protein
MIEPLSSADFSVPQAMTSNTSANLLLVLYLADPNDWVVTPDSGLCLEINLRRNIAAASRYGLHTAVNPT